MKIIADKQLKTYELTYLIPADYTDSQSTAVNEVITQLIAKFKGEVVDTQAWGKKTLAYKIKHQGKFHTEAAYVHLVIKFLPANVQAFEREVLLEEQVMRHLLVVAEDKVNSEAREGALGHQTEQTASPEGKKD